MSAVSSDKPAPRGATPPRDEDGSAQAAVTAEDGGVEAGGGRWAEHPSEITRRGWRDIAARLWTSITTDNLGMIAAGVAFYELLALFPALAALVSIYGLVADPASVRSLLDLTQSVLPSEANRLLSDELVSLVTAPSTGLSLTAVVSFLFTLWSAHNGAT